MILSLLSISASHSKQECVFSPMKCPGVLNYFFCPHYSRGNWFLEALECQGRNCHLCLTPLKGRLMSRAKVGQMFSHTPSSAVLGSDAEGKGNLRDLHREMGSAAHSDSACQSCSLSTAPGRGPYRGRE